MKKLLYGLIGVVVLAGTFVLALPTILHKAGMHPEYQGPTVALPAKRALVITTSHDVLAPFRMRFCPAWVTRRILAFIQK